MTTITNEKYDFTVKVNNEVDRARFIDLESEEEYIDTIRELVPGMIFMDIGACVGLHTLATMKLAKAVISIEPDPRNYANLVKYITSNNGNNVVPINVAVKNKRGSIKLYAEGERSDSPNTMPPSTNSLFTYTKANTYTQLIRSYDIPNIVKIDIEGDEWEIIEDVVKSEPDYICIEIHPNMMFKRGKEIGDVVLPLESKYNLVEQYPHGYQTNQIWKLR